jgi:DNA (cytosine-5)-methyltransferase 1
MGTLTAKADTVVAASTLLKLRGTCRDGQPTGDPLHTVSAGGTHFAQVYAFLIKYFGTATGQALTDPLHTATGKARFGVVTVTVDGVEYAIADIGMRMLTPRELYRAQGFPDGYVIGDEGDGRLSLTKTAQVRLCGNSVSPPVARALVAANVPELAFPGYVLRTKVRKGAGR